MATAAPVAAPSFAVSSPAPIALTAPSLIVAAPSAAGFAAALAPAPIAAAAARVAPAPDVRGQLQESARPADPAVDAGRAAFDGGDAALRSETAVAGAPSLGEGPGLARSVERASAPARSIPLRQRAAETISLAPTAFGFQLLTGIAYLNVGSHAWFPALAGAFWTAAGADMIAQLGRMRGFIVGGWQASHDQKMRHDYRTGELRDIRGRKYGEDRYDVWAPGRVSRRERFTVDAATVLLGLPWVVPAGMKAVALYAGGAAAGLAARAVWRRFHPEPVDEQPDFERDR
jgi:hypothetical protein